MRVRLVLGRNVLDIAVLTPVWGAQYISAFAEVGLPSLLASGNLGRICGQHDVDLVFITSTDGRDFFESLEITRKARETCSIRYVVIDDLISSANYGVTLTLAFARSMASYGEKQTSTAFIFFNSDFAVSNGSLSTVVRLLQDGHRCIIAPSLRVNAEAVFPALSKFAADHSGTLPLASREMVRLALRNLHFTVIGRTLTQDFVHCSQHGQFYWAVDKDTLVGAHHLIFHIAIMPEKPLATVNSYHDYCFVPEMIPSGHFTLIDDSDDFFMIEMQAQMQEKEMLFCGRADLKTMANELSRWATIEHRRFARVPVVFHAKDVPPRTQAAKRAAQQFVHRVQAMLVDPPTGYAFHAFWTLGVAAWITTKTADEAGQFVMPAELKRQVPGPPPVGAERDEPVPASRPLRLLWPRSRLEMRLRHIDARLFKVPIWHHRWCDVRAIGLFVKKSRDTVYLLSYERPEQCPENVRAFHSLDELLVAAAREEGPKRILLHVLRKDVRSLRPMLSALGRDGAFAADISVFIDHLDSELDPSDFSQELAQYTSEIMPDTWLAYDVSAAFTGGRFRRLLMRLEIAVRRRFVASPSPVKRAGAGIIWLALRGPLIGINVWGARNANPCPRYCSSAVLRLRFRENVGTAAAGCRQ